MRLLANKKGMSLNQRGLWDGVLRDTVTKQKISVGTQALFSILLN